MLQPLDYSGAGTLKPAFVSTGGFSEFYDVFRKTRENDVQRILFLQVKRLKC